MTYYETKIGKIIEEEFDSRMGNAVVSYIMDKGMSNVKEITDEQIEKLEGNGLMTQDFVQSLVRCARRICNECEWIELMSSFDYIYGVLQQYMTCIYIRKISTMSHLQSCLIIWILMKAKLVKRLSYL